MPVWFSSTGSRLSMTKTDWTASQNVLGLWAGTCERIVEICSSSCLRFASWHSEASFAA